MAAAKKMTLKQLKKAFEGKDLVESITYALTCPTSRIMHLMTCDDTENEEPIINMAIARAVYLAYSEGDVKRLEWLLNKIGIKDFEDTKKETTDMSKLNNDTILKALTNK